MDRLHSNVNILPWMEPFDKARFISAEIYWHGPFFSLADTVAVPLVPSQQLCELLDRGGLMAS